MAILGLTAFAASADVVVSGRLPGLAHPGRKVTVSVEAVRLTDGSVAASQLVRGSGYSLKVPPGAYIFVGESTDLRHSRQAVASRYVPVGHRHRRVNLSPDRAAAGPSATASAARGGALGIGDIHLNFGNHGQYSGGQAGIITGLLPICDKRGGAVYDRTRSIKRFIAEEQKRSDEGRLATPFRFQAPRLDGEISGDISPGAGGAPRADLTVTAPDGSVIKHYVVQGDPSDWDNLGGFENHIGDGLGRDLLKLPDDPCAPQPGLTTITFSGAYSETLTFYSPFGNPNAQKTETRTENVTWSYSWTGKDSELTDTSGMVLQWQREKLGGSTSDTYANPAGGGMDCQTSSLSAPPGQSFSAIDPSGGPPVAQLSINHPYYHAANCSLGLGCPGPSVSTGPTACGPGPTWDPRSGSKTYNYSFSQNTGSPSAGSTYSGSVKTRVVITVG